MNVQAILVAEATAALKKRVEERYGAVVKGAPKAISEYGVEYQQLKVVRSVHEDFQSTLDDLVATACALLLGLADGAATKEQRLVYRIEPELDYTTDFATGAHVLKFYARAHTIALTATPVAEPDGSHLAARWQPDGSQTIFGHSTIRAALQEAALLQGKAVVIGVQAMSGALSDSAPVGEPTYFSIVEGQACPVCRNRVCFS